MSPPPVRTRLSCPDAGALTALQPGTYQCMPFRIPSKTVAPLHTSSSLMHFASSFGPTAAPACGQRRPEMVGQPSVHPTLHTEHYFMQQCLCNARVEFRMGSGRAFIADAAGRCGGGHSGRAAVWHHCVRRCLNRTDHKAIGSRALAYQLPGSAGCWLCGPPWPALWPGRPRARCRRSPQFCVLIGESACISRGQA